MKENITDKEKKEIEEMTNELVAIVPMVKPKEDSYTDYCKQIATALRNVGYRKETIIVKEFAEKLKEKIEFREQELITSCKQIEETDMLECDLFRTAREYGLYNIIDQLAKENGVEEE